MGEILFLIVAVIFALLGLAGSVLPVLPGAFLSFSAIVILYFLKPGLISISTLILFGVLAAIAMFSDYILPAAGAKKFGASKSGIWGLIIGMILGFMMFSFIGMMVGAVAGAIFGELSGGKSSEKAMRSGFAVIWGMALSAILKFSISLIMAIYFFIKLVGLAG